MQKPCLCNSQSYHRDLISFSLLKHFPNTTLLISFPFIYRQNTQRISIYSLKLLQTIYLLTKISDQPTSKRRRRDRRRFRQRKLPFPTQAIQVQCQWRVEHQLAIHFIFPFPFRPSIQEEFISSLDIEKFRKIYLLVPSSTTLAPRRPLILLQLSNGCL